MTTSNSLWFISSLFDIEFSFINSPLACANFPNSHVFYDFTSWDYHEYILPWHYLNQNLFSSKSFMVKAKWVLYWMTVIFWEEEKHITAPHLLPRLKRHHHLLKTLGLWLYEPTYLTQLNIEDTHLLSSIPNSASKKLCDFRKGQETWPKLFVGEMKN